MYKAQPSCVDLDPFKKYLKTTWDKAKATRVIKIKSVVSETALAVKVPVEAVSESGYRKPIMVWVPKSSIYPDGTIERRFWETKRLQVLKDRVFPAYFLIPIAA
jgi:flagella basal body P-ring formation protein FlgA